MGIVPIAFECVVANWDLLKQDRFCRMRWPEGCSRGCSRTSVKVRLKSNTGFKKAVTLLEC